MNHLPATNKPVNFSCVKMTLQRGFGVVKPSAARAFNSRGSGSDHEKQKTSLGRGQSSISALGRPSIPRSAKRNETPIDEIQVGSHGPIGADIEWLPGGQLSKPIVAFGDKRY